MKRVCPQCGAERTDESLSGLCPKCLARYSFLDLEGEAGGVEEREQPAQPLQGSRQSDLEVERSSVMIGRYKLLEQIGEGGFGLVYMAEQMEPVHRKVALKVIKAGMDTKAVVARFEAERQALALMDHPNIARVLDAGTTQAGRPYFVMELVRGIPITEYCDQNRLSTPERLELSMTVCRAVQHAHQKGIIHRDLKPGNVLVSSHDGRPVPKIIDFGVAKALGQRLTEKTLFTGFTHMIGTPAYMSPEQAELSGLDVDTRSDIYSLGVLLYELLTGDTPFDRETLARAALDEVRRMIRETQPPKPSTRLHTLGQTLAQVAASRQTEAAKLIHLVRGDLDWIVMKCLEKDRTRRYETANGVAMDVKRYLDNEPIIARPPSKLYEFQKTVRRHKFGFIAAGSVMVALMIGLVVATLALVREREAREQAVAAEKQARKEAQKATASTEAVSALLTSADPDSLKGADYTVRELLDDASAQIPERYHDYPGLELELRRTVGKAYAGILLGEKAVPHFERAIEISQALYGSENNKTAELYYECALAWHESFTVPKQVRWEHAEPYLRKAKAFFRQQGSTHREELMLSLRLEMMFMHRIGRLSEVQRIGREILETSAKTPELRPDILSDCLHNFGLLRLKQGRPREAELFLRRSLVTRRRILPENDPENSWILRDLGAALLHQGRLTEARTNYEEALALFTYHWSPWQDPQALEELSEILERQRDWPPLKQVLEYMQTSVRENTVNRDPENHDASLELARMLLQLATAEAALDHRQEADEFGQEAMGIVSNLVVTSHDEANGLNRLAWPLVIKVHPHSTEVTSATMLAEKAVAATGRTNGNILDTLAAAYATSGDFTRAIGVQQEAIAHTPQDRKDLGEEFKWRLTLYKSGVRYCERWPDAQGLADLGRMEEAKALLREELDILRKLAGSSDRESALVLSRFALLMVQHQKAEQAESFARECLTLHEKYRPESWLAYNARSLLGACLLGQKRFSEAEPLLLSGYEGLAARQKDIPSHERFVTMESATERLAELYDQLGKPKQADQWRQKIAAIDLITY